MTIKEGDKHLREYNYSEDVIRWERENGKKKYKDRLLKTMMKCSLLNNKK